MFQKQIVQVCQQFYPNLIVQDRTFIFPFQIDILIPDINLAIEFNGLKYHSQLVGINKFYHSKKYQLCKQKGYQLFIIWDFEWKNNKEKIINNLLSYFNNKLIPITTNINNNILFVNDNKILQLEIKGNEIIKYSFNPKYDLSYSIKLLTNNRCLSKKLQLGKESQKCWINAGFKIKKFIQPKQRFKYGIKYYNCGYLILQKK